MVEHCLETEHHQPKNWNDAVYLDSKSLCLVICYCSHVIARLRDLGRNNVEASICLLLSSEVAMVSSNLVSSIVSTNGNKECMEQFHVLMMLD